MVKIFICVAFVVILSGKNFVEAHDNVNVTQYPGRLCERPCVQNQERICYYEWVLEHYHAMGPACGRCPDIEADCDKPQCIVGDGIQKGVMSINRLIPGPPINVCKGDNVIVDVVNMAAGTAASIHWHGLHMVETPYMDGVPFTTQCPIPFETTFRYSFYATQAGTQFYHSHSGHHKLNGQYGALIIRQPDNLTPNKDQYEKDLSEHYILISDWKHGYAEQSAPGLPRGESFPDSLLINGRGTYIDKNTLKHTSIIPVTKYLVEPGFRYRFRLISSVSLTCACSVQVEGHSMVIIATDSNNVEPFKIDSLVINAGERYDFVIEANKIKGDFWIRVRGQKNCQTQPTDTFALLRYGTKSSDMMKSQPAFPAYNNTFPIGHRLNHPSATCFQCNGTESCAADLKGLDTDDDLVKGEPDYRLKLSFNNYIIPPEKGFIPGKYVRFDNPEGDTIAAGVVNNMSFIFPSVPALTQYSEMDQNIVCDVNHWPEHCKGNPYCPCFYTEKIKTNSIVELTIIDAMDVPGLDHPFHLHGYNFAVMGIEKQTPNEQTAIESARKFKKSRPVYKDTISVPMNGLAVVRFRANNPGFWLMHCHYELHMATGMALIFQVGEPKEWVQAPEGFPRCRNYKPNVKQIGC